MAHLDSEVKEERLREDLKFYFMNPCEKFRARQQIPWKLGLQILKIVMVTSQVNDTISSFCCCCFFPSPKMKLFSPALPPDLCSEKATLTFINV